jgi:hypothetical protein
MTAMRGYDTDLQERVVVYHTATYPPFLVSPDVQPPLPKKGMVRLPMVDTIPPTLKAFIGFRIGSHIVDLPASSVCATLTVSFVS